MPDVLTLRVAGIRRATPRTRILTLRLDGQPFSFHAGQAVLLGPAERGADTPYSIASAPREVKDTGRLMFLVKADSDRPGGLAGIGRGSRIAVKGPLGSFHLPDRITEPNVLLVAGGTGIAPLRSMIAELVARPHRPAITVLYGARSTDEFAFATELRRWAREGAIDLVLTASREAHGRWRGARGRIGQAHLEPLVRQPKETLCFVCGPESMVDATPPILRELGVPAHLIRREEW